MADLLAGLGILLQVLSHHWANLFGSRAGNLQPERSKPSFPNPFEMVTATPPQVALSPWDLLLLRRPQSCSMEAAVDAFFRVLKRTFANKGFGTEGLNTFHRGQQAVL